MKYEVIGEMVTFFFEGTREESEGRIQNRRGHNNVSDSGSTIDPEDTESLITDASVDISGMVVSGGVGESGHEEEEEDEDSSGREKDDECEEDESDIDDIIPMMTVSTVGTLNTESLAIVSCLVSNWLSPTYTYLSSPKKFGFL